MNHRQKEHSVKLENQLPFIMTKIACFSLKHKLPNVLKAISFLLKNWARKCSFLSLQERQALPKGLRTVTLLQGCCNYLLTEPTRLQHCTSRVTAERRDSVNTATLDKETNKGPSEPESGYWLGFRFEQRNHRNTGSKELE